MIISGHNSNTRIIPYVSDGLIAMYDSQWNVGMDKQKSYITEIWRDISGNERHIDVSDYSWSDNGLEVKNGGVVIQPHTFPLCDIAQIEIVCLNYRTSEDVNPGIGFEYNGMSTSTAYDFGILGGHPYSGPARLGFKCHTCLVGLIEVKDHSLEKPIMFFSSETYDINNKQNNKILLNGSVSANFYHAHNPNFSGILMLRFAKNFPSALKCVRFYNRELSKTEILSNYNIDVTRYGQPTI